MSSRSFNIPALWSVARGDVLYALCRSSSAQRSLPDNLDLFEVIFLSMPLLVYCLNKWPHVCVWGATPYNSINTKGKDVISKSEIYIMPFGFFCDSSDSFTSRLHYCLHKIGSRSSVPPIYTAFPWCIYEYNVFWVPWYQLCSLCRFRGCLL